jgi:hypothetical protein
MIQKMSQKTTGKITCATYQGLRGALPLGYKTSSSTGETRGVAQYRWPAGGSPLRVSTGTEPGEKRAKGHTGTEAYMEGVTRDRG